VRRQEGLTPSVTILTKQSGPYDVVELHVRVSQVDCTRLREIEQSIPRVVPNGHLQAFDKDSSGAAPN
jgi:hypothetical protein